MGLGDNVDWKQSPPRREERAIMTWHRALTANLGLKLTATLLAVVLYLHVVTEREVEQLLFLPVEVTGLADTLALSSDPPTELGVRVRGTGKQLIRLRVIQPLVFLDLSGVGAGSFQRGLTAADFKSVSDENVEVLSPLEPATVNIRLEPRATDRVAVSVRLSGEPARGYVIAGDAAVRPEQVRISGPESWIYEQEGIETVALDISGQREDVDAMLALAPTPGWVRVSPGSVLVTVPIEMESRGVRAIAPVIEGLRGTNFTARVDPPEVDVLWRAPESRVDEVLSNIQVRVDVARRGRGRYILPVQVAGAGTTYVQSVSPESVAVTLH
jgi:YbbR domain-containing protein